MEINPAFEHISEENIEIEPIHDFMPKPFGDHTEKNFNILYHVRLKQPKKKTEEELAAAAAKKEKKENSEEKGEEEVEEEEEEDDDEGIVPDENKTY